MKGRLLLLAAAASAAALGALASARAKPAPARRALRATDPARTSTAPDPSRIALLPVEPDTEARVRARDADPSGRVLPRGSRSLLVHARGASLAPTRGVALVLEGASDGGDWLAARRAETDAFGDARFEGLLAAGDYRVRADFAGAPRPVDVGARRRIELDLDAPGLAEVALRTRAGEPLLGARRVVYRADGSKNARTIELVPALGGSAWGLPLGRSSAGTITAWDSLGQPWSAAVHLAPGTRSTVAPGDRWLAIRSPDHDLARGDGRARFEWSIAVGDRRPRRGSTRARGASGFHALLPTEAARSGGGRLELTLHTAGGARRRACAWPPDPDLHHLRLDDRLSLEPPSRPMRADPRR
ncbi:MAG: hypothetical protein AAFR54_00395 [Planctomycetota bacterium]